MRARKQDGLSSSRAFPTAFGTLLAASSSTACRSAAVAVVLVLWTPGVRAGGVMPITVGGIGAVVECDPIRAVAGTPPAARAFRWRSAGAPAAFEGPGPAGQAPQQDVEVVEAAPLSEAHRRWLEEEVVYIISPLERNAFEMLTSDAARDAFIQAFWRTRDPTPGTARNEVREEHHRRIEHANRFLGRETPRAGWQTDRGRIYIQLGEPRDIQSFPNPKSFWPMELWFYSANPRATDLPPFFYVLFYRPQAGDEWELYDPIADGPNVLAKQILLQLADPAVIVRNLLQGIGHEVAIAAVNMNPNERVNFSNPSPSPGNALIMSAIEEAPLAGVDVEYARAFAINRGDVEATVTYAGMPADLSAAALWDERGMPFLHFAVEIPPERMLVGQYEREYFFSFEVGVEAKDLRGEAVTTAREDLEEYFDEARFERIMRSPLAYLDRVALVPGVYDVTITVRNKITSERAVQRRRVSVPAPSEHGSQLSDLLVARSAVPLDVAARTQLRAFRFGNLQYIPAAAGRVARGGTLDLFAQLVAGPSAAAGEVELAAAILDAGEREVVSVRAPSVPLEPAPAPTRLHVTLPLDDVPVGVYRVRLTARLPGGEVVTRERPFEVVLATDAPSPEVLLASEAPVGTIEEYRERGWQHLRKGERRAAANYFEAALQLEPGVVPLRRALAQLLIEEGSFAEAAAALRPLVASPQAAPSDALMLSRALRGAGAASEAAATARAALQRWRPTPAAYNELAEALLEAGDRGGAVAALQQSLALDADQPEIRERLRRLQQ